jgi:hypothetical protein
VAFNVSCTSYNIRAKSVSSLLPQHVAGLGNKIACSTECGNILCGLQRLLYFSIIHRMFIRRSLSGNCSFHQKELLVSLSEHRSFLRRTLSVKNANLGITNLPEFVTFFTVCTTTFQLLIEVSWFNKHKREIGNLAGRTIPVLATSGPGGSRRLRSQISGQSAHEGGKVVSPTHWLPLPAGNIPSTLFC